MKKIITIAILCISILGLLTVLAGCPNTDNGNTSNGSTSKITDSLSLNRELENMSEEETLQLMDDNCFAEFCNENTIKMLYEKYKSKAIIQKALDKANDKTLGDSKIIIISSTDGTTFSANVLLETFEVGKMLPNSVERAIKEKLNVPSSMQIEAVDYAGNDEMYVMVFRGKFTWWQRRPKVYGFHISRLCFCTSCYISNILLSCRFFDI